MDQRNDSVSNLGLVLIADDDDDFRRLLVRRAKRMGLRVVEARDGCEALEAVKRQSFDALVLDLYMPGASGIEVLEAGSRIDPEVQTILLTGNASLETAVEALRAGAYDYLTKPLDSLTVFELALTRALEHRHLLQDNARLFAEVQRLAVTDPLTGLYNRHKLNEALAAEVERAQRYGRPLALIMLDLDNLKRVNDSLGHPAGDEVLKQVADIIRQEIRRVDIATRFGGDEFLVVLPEADIEEAVAVALRIHRSGQTIAIEGLPISFSLGVTELRAGITNLEEFLHEVDKALYAAKEAGRGCVSRTNGVVDDGATEGKKATADKAPDSSVAK